MSARRKQTFPVGHYFLTFHPDGSWNWAGRVVGGIALDRYEVVIFDAMWLSMCGEISEHTRQIMSLDDMRGWEFHADIERFWNAVGKQIKLIDRRCDKELRERPPDVATT